MRRCFEKELGPFRVVDAIIKAPASGGFRFLHARVAAAMIGYARCPHFLLTDGGKQTIWQFHRFQFQSGQFSNIGLQIFRKILAAQQVIPHKIRGGIPPVLVFHNAALSCAVEFHFEVAMSNAISIASFTLTVPPAIFIGVMPN